MRIISVVFIMLSCLAASAQGVAALAGTAYYISTSGSDANTGLSTGASWLTANHAVHGQDIIWASTGSYAAGNFGSGKWGAVDSNGPMARVICATFDGCKINGSSGILIDKSYWSVQGWEVTTSNGGCFLASPSTAANIHHIMFANDVANGCFNGGFGSYPTGTNGVDYFAVVGSIAYNAAQASVHCYSGISIYEPVRWDTVGGTHLYAGFNYSFGNEDNPSGTTCQGTAKTDGDGLIFDTFDGSQTAGLSSYDQQAYGSNNILVANKGWGLEVQNNSAGTSHAPIYLKNNTMWGNRTDPHGFSTVLCASTAVNVGVSVTIQGNIDQTSVANSCPTSNSLYGMYVYNGDATDVVSGNWIKAASGNHTGTFGSGAFAFGSNTTGTDPLLSAPAAPVAPSCTGTLNVADCMGTVRSNFAATATGASAYGFQPISSVNGSDPLFPKWVCSCLPSGIASKSC